MISLEQPAGAAIWTSILHQAKISKLTKIWVGEDNFATGLTTNGKIKTTRYPYAAIAFNYSDKMYWFKFTAIADAYKFVSYLEMLGT